MALNGMAWYGVVWYGMVWYGAQGLSHSATHWREAAVQCCGRCWDGASSGKAPILPAPLHRPFVNTASQWSALSEVWYMFFWTMRYQGGGVFLLLQQFPDNWNSNEDVSDKYFWALLTKGGIRGGRLYIYTCTYIYMCVLGMISGILRQTRLVGLESGQPH